MKYLTNSEMQMYKDCRRKWWLSVYRRLDRRRPETSRPRDVGNIAHNVLDVYYGHGFSKEAAWAKWSEECQEMKDKFPEASKEEAKDIAWIAEMTRVMLEGYFEWVEETGADVGLTVVAPEAQLAVPLRGQPGITLLGKIDLRVYSEAENARQFLENKTVGNFSDLEKTANINEQMLQYQLLEYLDMLERGAEEPVTGGGTFNLIKRSKRTRAAKPPFFKRVSVWHNLDVLRNYWTRVAAVGAGILEAEERLNAGEDHMRVCYPSPSKDCSWKCDFFQICYMLDDPGSHAEARLAANFVEKDPLERYAAVLATD